jgi:hypothetical protein
VQQHRGTVDLIGVQPAMLVARDIEPLPQDVHCASHVTKDPNTKATKNTKISLPRKAFVFFVFFVIFVFVRFDG